MDNPELNTARRLLRRANFRIRAEEFEQAYELLNKSLDYLPDSVEIHRTLGRIALVLDNNTAALQHARDCLELDNNEISQIDVGIALLANGNIEEGVDLFNNLSLPSTTPTHIKKLANLWKSISKILNKEDLEVQLRNLKSILPEFTENYSPYIGYALHHLGRHNEAVAQFRKTKENWRSTHALGAEYYQMGNHESAHYHFIEALELYEKVEKQDAAILNKLKYDILLSQEPSEEKTAQLIDYANEEKSLLSYQAVIYDLFTQEQYSEKFVDWLSRVEDEYPDNYDSELHDAWKQKYEESKQL